MESSETERLVMEDLEGGFVLVDFDEDPVAQDPKEELMSDDDDELRYTNSVTLKRTRKFPRTRWAVNINPPRQEQIKDAVKSQVLTFLPAKSLYRFRAVSKDWDSWISAPFFAHEQSTHFTKLSGLFSQFPGEAPSFTPLDRRSCGVPTPSLRFLPEHVQVRATDGGLLCCRSLPGSYYICNPVTKQWTKLPEPNMYHGPETAVGLSFEPSQSSFSANYQLVCAVVSTISPPIDDDDDRVVVVSFEVYSSRSGEWRVCDAVYCGDDLGAPEFVGDGLYLNGFVHWETGGGKVLTFDVKNEDCGVLALPPGNGPHGSLAVIAGELCYLLPSSVSVEELEIDDEGAIVRRQKPSSWVVEVYGDMDMKLKRVISINDGRRGGDLYGNNVCCRALALQVGGDHKEVVIAVFGRDIVAYDVEAEKGKVIGKARDDGFEKFLPYVNNLVHVKVGGGVDMEYGV